LKDDESKGQFEISDARTLKEVTDTIRKAGYDPVFKNWDNSYKNLKKLLK
jgi:2-iminoacetate synthase